MANERSDRQYENWLQESMRFDYFVLGITVAGVGYLASHWKPERLGLNPCSLELASILAGLLAAMAAFKRAEALLVSLSLSHRQLAASEAAGQLMMGVEGSGTMINRQTGEIFTAKEAVRRAGVQKELSHKAIKEQEV